ncbi:MAG: hypothetical protein ABIT96_09560 [Ferruginibacter sp.]
MKTKIIPILIVLTSILLSVSCKKNKTQPVDTTCGCATTSIKYRLEEQAGSLSYFASKAKWVFVYQPLPGNYSYYFPCNTSQDSLRIILQNANTTQTFNVKMSGKVKSTCPGEDFGVTSGVTTFDYIIIDSLKRY